MSLFLVGMPGSGKSTVAQILSNTLGWPLKSSDLEIERMEGRNIAELFSQFGEQRFRQLEADWFYRLPGWGNFIADTGGGLPCHHHLMLGIRSRGPSVYLKSTPETLINRLNFRGTWPSSLITKEAEELIKMLEKRRIYYQLADLHLETDHLSPSEVAEKIITYFELR